MLVKWCVKLSVIAALTGSVAAIAEVDVVEFAEVDVTDFGGAADGKTDNAPAFRQAMEKVADAGGGRIVFPPAPMPYLVTDTLLVDVSHVEVRGDGATVLLADGANDGRQAHVIHVRGTEDEPIRHVTLRGLTVDANYWAQEDAARPRGIQIEWARDVLVDRVRIVRPWVGLSFGRGSVDGEARDCEVNLWHNDAYSVDGAGFTGSTKRIRLLRCRAVGSLNEADGGLPGRRDNAFEIEDGCQDVQLIDCLVAVAGGNGFGIRNHAQPREVETRRIVLTRCVVQDVPSALLAWARGGDNRVTDLRLVDCDLRPGARFFGISGDIQITGGRLGELSLGHRFRDGLPEDATPLENALVRDAVINTLRADTSGIGVGELRVEGATIV